MNRVLILVVALGILVAGCGEEPSDTWAEEANAICREALDELERLPEPETEEQLAQSIERYNSVGRRMERRLRQLEPPADKADRARRMIDAYAAVVPVQEKMAEAARAGDLDRLDDLVGKMQELGSRGDKLALELGADECAKEAGDDEPDADVD